ncbi:MAG: rhodanese-like domain-containing protein [Cytophagales bacterium]|nr:rhodanese-like domain-containing protein [Bernardetiaceae bacterium]MDW8205327.1 rhodanese-like domain-containing protein [Cytophagales bacterium]
MKIEQFEDKGLAHYAYAILSESDKSVVLVDPARNPQPYYDFAAAHGATIVGVIETHPHADFVSSHLEIAQQTGAKIYVSKLLGAEYEHVPFDEGDTISLGDFTLRALNTPGHSPDSISIVLSVNGKDYAVFTGDTLFIGDVGRPDLRESVGNLTAQREELARQMYHSTREKLMKLDDDVLVFPAHGAGSLCGKALSGANSSTIGAEKMSNYALRPMSEDEFVKELIADQPFVPKYFGFDVLMNKKGAPAYQPSISSVPRLQPIRSQADTAQLDRNVLIVDARPQVAFRKGHLRNSINLMNGGKFETWLGSIVNPGEPYYLAAADEATLNELIAKAAKIGYEGAIKGAFVLDGSYTELTSPEIDLEAFRKHPSDYAIVDIRNWSEINTKKIFEGSLAVPLPELRERISEIPRNKPVVVHCAGGYRSAAGASIIANLLEKEGVTVYDLSEAITTFN